MDATIRELMSIPNIGKAMAGDLVLLGIHSIADLKSRDPDELYVNLCQATSCRQDPCVWDTFAAAVHFAKTGETKKWWEYTAERKRRGLPTHY